jgi:hypothetical protein
MSTLQKQQSSNLLTENTEKMKSMKAGRTQAAEGSGEESDGTTLSSEFGETADSASLWMT